MRILSVSTDYPGPDQPRRGLFVKRRLAALAERTDLTVLHLRPWFPVLRPARSGEADGSGEWPPVLRKRMFYLPGVLKGWDSYWVERAVVPSASALDAEGRVELIDAHFGYPEGAGCVRAAIRLDRPVFITMRGLESQVLAHHRRRAQLLWALRCCTGVICVADSLRELAVRHGVAPDKIRVIPNAVDRDTFHADDRAESRRALGVEPSCRLIVSVGMLVHGKGHHLLLEAVAKLSRKQRDLRVVIVGGRAHEPSYPDRLRRMADALGVGPLVRFAGSLPPGDVARWLRAADLFALATYDEGCCNAILEAMACGVPVVTTAVGGNAELVDPPLRGLLVPPGSGDELADVMEQALDRSWDRQAIASFGSDYTWADVARRTEAFFRSAMAGVPGAGSHDSAPVGSGVAR